MGGNKDRLKRPKAATGKRVKAHEVPERPDSDDCPPAFCFQYMVDDYSVDACGKDDQAMLAQAIFRRRNLTWKQLRTEHKHALGSETIDHLLMPRPRGVTEDVRILAFRFSGKKAMVGFREDQIFHVVWLDHDFSVYKHS